jgi:Zn-dependent peptidase ImmA (M78 family)
MDDFDSTRNLLSSIDQFSKMDPNAIEKFYKLAKSSEFMKMKLSNPNLRQKDICDRMGVSEYSITRTRKDLGIISPYRYDKPVRKSRKKKVEDTDNIPTTSKNVKKVKPIKKRLPKVTGGTIDDNAISNLINETNKLNIKKSYLNPILNNEEEIDDTYIDKLLGTEK